MPLKSSIGSEDSICVGLRGRQYLTGPVLADIARQAVRRPTRLNIALMTWLVATARPWTEEERAAYKATSNTPNPDKAGDGGGGEAKEKKENVWDQDKEVEDAAEETFDATKDAAEGAAAAAGAAAVAAAVAAAAAAEGGAKEGAEAAAATGQADKAE
jgi:hypothetical protein